MLRYEWHLMQVDKVLCVCVIKNSLIQNINEFSHCTNEDRNGREYNTLNYTVKISSLVDASLN